MSEDIVKALRELDADKPDPWSVCCEAADEIERLRKQLRLAIMSDSEEGKELTAQNDALRAALNKGGGDE